MSIKIMIDSASDFTKEQAEELGLIHMPIAVRIENEEYLDGVTIFADQFYEILEKCNKLPQTSLINEFCWEEAFERETADGSEVIAITLSSKLSGTYNAAKNASEKFGGKVIAIDSLNAAYGEAILGLYALELRGKGLSFEDIVLKLNQKKQDICVYAVIDTLKYLKLGGRISATTAFIGSTLSIKPIIAIIDGEVKMVGKAMGNRRGNLMLNSMIKEVGGIDFEMPFGYVWSGRDKTNIERYVLDSKSIVGDRDCSLNILGGTIGTHIGPGAVGLVFFKNTDK